MAAGGSVRTRDHQVASRRSGGTRLAVAAAVTGGGALLAYLALVGKRYGLDLQVYRASASAVLNGHDPYDRVFTASRLPATYPPFAFVLLSWFAWGPFAFARCLMWVLSIVAATASVFIVLRDQGHPGQLRLWASSFAWACGSMLAIEPPRSSIDYGQIEFLLMFLVVADLLLVRPPVRGVALGVAGAIKLTPLAFILVLVTRRDRRSVFRAGASFVVCGALAWAVWPGLSRTYWFHDLLQVKRIGTIAYSGNQSWYAVVHRAPFHGHGSTAVWLALSVVTIALGTFVAWRCDQTGRRSFALVPIALLALLVSPVSWSHHWIWVILVPPLLVGRGRAQVTAGVRASMWVLVALTIAAPYWWLNAGAADDALEALLPAWAFVLLAVWSAAEYRRWKTPTALASEDPAATDHIAAGSGGARQAGAPHR